MVVVVLAVVGWKRVNVRMRTRMAVDIDVVSDEIGVFMGGGCVCLRLK